MSKQAVLFLLFGFMFSVLSAQNISDKPVNLGVKLGFNAVVPDVTIETDADLLTSKITNKVGYMAEAFMRLNMQKFYVQPEVSYSLTKGNFDLQRANYTSYASVDVEVTSVDFSALLGYSTVKEAQYGLGVFAGLKTKASSRVTIKAPGLFENTSNELFYNTYVTMGLGVNISRLFFDFRYDIALKRNSMDMSALHSDTYGEIRMTHKDNILGFSIGVIF